MLPQRLMMPLKTKTWRSGVTKAFAVPRGPVVRTTALLIPGDA
jgi:hypothetical protein